MGRKLLDLFLPEDERGARRRALAAVLGFLALLLHQAWRVGPTYDEHFYIAAGYAYLADLDFALNREHPPLVKMLVGLPLHFAPGVDQPAEWQRVVNYPVAFFFERNAADLDRNLFLGRLPICLASALLGWVLFRTGRRLWGPRAGLIALAMYAFNPNVLAHGCLAGLDSGLMVFFFLAVLAFSELLEDPSPRRALGAGVLFGLANAAKFTSLVLGPAFLGIAALQVLRKRSAAPLGWTALVLFSGLGVFAATYGFEAKSVNEAWAVPEYVNELRNPEVHEVLPGHLAEVAQEHGLAAADARQLAAAPSLPVAIDMCAVGLDADATAASAALEALRVVALGREGDRKRAFAVALDGGPNVDAALQLEVLAELADVRFGDLESWRGWYERNKRDSWDRVIFTQPWIESLTRGLLGDARPIPLFTAIKGIDYQLYHGSFGHGSYYRGETLWAPFSFEDGNPYPEYYADVMWVKNTIPWLVLAALGLLGALLPGRNWGLVRALCFAGIPVGLFLVFSKGSALMGVRYVLPIFPFLALLAGRVSVRFPGTALTLVLVASAIGLRYHPHHLMHYSIAAGGSAEGPEITVVGDDWGQGVRAVGRFYARHREAIDAAGGLHYTPYSIGDARAYGLEDAIPVHGPVEGIVAVHAISYWRDQPSPTDARRSYAWLDDYEPFLVIDRSVYVYDTRAPAPGGDPLADW